MPVFRPCSAATFPVAAATAAPASTPPREATHDTARSMPSGWTPDPAGLSVPITRRPSSPRRATSAATSPAAFTFPLCTISTRAVVSSRIRSTWSSGSAVGPPFTWPATSGRTRTTKSAPTMPLPGIEAPPVCTITRIPHACAQRVISAATSASFTPEIPISPTRSTPAAAISRKSASVSPGSSSTAPACTFTPDGRSVRERRVREDRERLHPGGIGRTARRVRLARRDHRRRPAVQVRVDEVDLELSRREVAEHRMRVVVAEAGRHGRAGGVDHGVDARSIGARRVPDVGDRAVADDDRVAVGDRRRDVPARDRADVADQEVAHRRPFSPTTSDTCSPPTRGSGRPPSVTATAITSSSSSGASAIRSSTASKWLRTNAASL